MKKNFSSLSTGLMLAIDYTNKKQVQLADDMAGVFIVVLSQMKEYPNTTFFYYDNRSSRIVNHLVYRGKSYYKEFGNFVINTLTNHVNSSTKTSYLYLFHKFIVIIDLHKKYNF
jgi:hypothetical protein